MMQNQVWRVAILAMSCLMAMPSAAIAREPGLLFAHRGGAHEFEENTMQAFRRSYQHGLRGFETDVRMTKDGQLVLLHDDALDRTHRGSGPVEQKLAAELRSIVSKKGREPLVFLEELLAYFADKPGVYLELEMKTKNTGLYPADRLEMYCGKLYDAVQSRMPEGSTYVFTSFDERPLRIIKRLDPHADMLFITDGPCSENVIKHAQELGVNRIGVRIDQTSRGAVRQAQQAGLLVSGWPGHNLQDYHLAVGLGLDAICTDVPVAIQTWKQKHE